jgi:uncharacterized membrane protein HdeD (DUF308 family)
MNSAPSATENGSLARDVDSFRGGESILGFVFILCGIWVILAPMFTTLTIILATGAALAVAGVVQIAQAFSKSWGGLIIHILLGLAYLIAGAAFWLNPFHGAILMTLVFGSLLVVQGLGEIAMALGSGTGVGRSSLLMTGAVSIAVGAYVLVAARSSGVIMPALVVGVTLILEGFSLVLVGQVRRGAVAA